MSYIKIVILVMSLGKMLYMSYKYVCIEQSFVSSCIHIVSYNP